LLKCEIEQVYPKNGVIRSHVFGKGSNAVRYIRHLPPDQKRMIVKLTTFMVGLYISLALVSNPIPGNGQIPRGNVVVTKIIAPSIQNNPAGENATRSITVYLPPDYDKTTNRYPVIYYLHAFRMTDSLHFLRIEYNRILDTAIFLGKIKPVISVVADNNTLFRGSLYTNSTFTGKWADYNAKDVVDFVDKNFRTVAQKEGRGLAGDSQGGGGALKIGMMYANVFSVVYAMSPSVLGFTKDLGIEGVGFKRIQFVKTRDELITGSGYENILANAVIAIGRAFSPNPNNPPFYADLPYIYIGDSVQIKDDILDLWKKNSPIVMIDRYKENLKTLKALKLDWGRNDEITHVPPTCRAFSDKLENLGINHFAEEYLGKHYDKIWTTDGRVMNQMLPFFNDYLKFEEIKYLMNKSKR
jgi:S-formylglutathione hydrolase FrmB